MKSCVTGIGTFDVDGVRLGIERVDDQSRVERHVERDVMSAAHAWRQRRRSDARTIRHLIRVRSKTITSFGRLGGAGNVTWSHDHRKNKLIRAVYVAQRFHVT